MYEKACHASGTASSPVELEHKIGSAAASRYLGPYFSHKMETTKAPRGRRREERVWISGAAVPTHPSLPPFPQTLPHLLLHSTHPPTPDSSGKKKPSH